MWSVHTAPPPPQRTIWSPFIKKFIFALPPCHKLSCHLIRILLDLTVLFPWSVCHVSTARFPFLIGRAVLPLVRVVSAPFHFSFQSFPGPFSLPFFFLMIFTICLCTAENKQLPLWDGVRFIDYLGEYDMFLMLHLYIQKHDTSSHLNP